MLTLQAPVTVSQSGDKFGIDNLFFDITAGTVSARWTIRAADGTVVVGGLKSYSLAAFAQRFMPGTTLKSMETALANDLNYTPLP